ncbi:MAG: heavy metal translocating P-type ATPase, partial [Candidatus Latescibacteria bacterium]|nr:heavy metal translocating P-type ATPase [Candidatus Latescibacterota bacterium]
MNRFRFRWIEFLRSADLQMALTGACAAFGIAGALVGHLHAGPPGLKQLLYLVSYGTGGFGPGRALIHNLLKRELDINLLMIVAALGSASIGHWGEGAVLLFLFSLSGALER